MNRYSGAGDDYVEPMDDMGGYDAKDMEDKKRILWEELHGKNLPYTIEQYAILELFRLREKHGEDNT